MELINIDVLPETNVDWFADGERASALVLNRPAKQIATIINNNAAITVEKTSNTGSAKIPSGLTAERDVAPVFGAMRANSDFTQMEWYNGVAWTGMGGATGGPGNPAFYENDVTITSNYTITTNKNAMSAGPITINTGVAVTVPVGSVWTII